MVVLVTEKCSEKEYFELEWAGDKDRHVDKTGSSQGGSKKKKAYSTLAADMRGMLGSRGMVTLMGSFRLSTVIGLLFLSYRLMVTKRVLASRMSLAPSEYESGRKVFSDICT